LKITTAESGPSIITAARSLIKAGARENKKKKSINEADDIIFIDADQNQLLAEDNSEAVND
jgi:DNA recombination protein RmuC